MLSPYRVLDLCHEHGMICGQILGDLGADVIAIEPPSGASARHTGPFYQDIPHPDRSLYWWAYSRNKRSITLDVTTPEGQETLRRLVVNAHFLIESFAPGTLAAYGLGYDDLSALNPALVYVSITPFGQSGPKAAYTASDLTLLAAGGQLVLTGDHDRAPVRTSVPQAELHAGAEAASAALVAHHASQRSGRGQHVDVSAQLAVALTTMSRILNTPLEATESTRSAGGIRIGELKTRSIWPTQDGYVSLGILGGPGIGRFTQRLMAWMYEEGFCDAATRDKDWLQYAELVFSGEEPLDEFERVQQMVEAFTRSKTKLELLRAALDRGLLVAPLSTIDETVDNPHLADRQYWTPLTHPELGRSIRYPGPFVRLSATPIAYRRRPPAVGEHTLEIEAELAASPEPAPEAAPHHIAPVSRPLSDVKVLDFTWVMAGPTATRVLSDYGATVVRVESAGRLDPMRMFGPYHDGEPGPENSGWFQNINAGKMSLRLNLSNRAAHSVVHDLVRWADVVTESFSPKAMRAWQFDYKSLRRLKPDLIMLSTCLMGQSGPYSQLAGYGNLASAIAGFDALVGWPDRAPAGLFIAYTDTIAPRFTVAALLAALEYRRRTGVGQYIDQAQLESALQFLSPALLDYVVNGRVRARMGNDDAQMAPHGVYPALGEDRWIAMAVQSDAQWQALCELMQEHDGVHFQVDRFAQVHQRLAHRAELDAMLSPWTRLHDPHALEATLQAHGIAASVVLTMDDLYQDPQLAHRGHLIELSHPIHTTTTVEGSRFQLSDTPAQIACSAPILGCDTQYVLENFLGYSSDQINNLVSQEILR
ncbi:CaiB/BaiF CoA transferase family protein [Candidatus Entotheonella palauensis]|uniref:CaiB/BaiF CoA transferase family protein n=1 Tax=Candidatus Entotheonella palauensis TaxID=93172 RepID=UPI000B7D67E8|nr:CoA transferase [Candidatus Entotheonella palauensis]